MNERFYYNIDYVFFINFYIDKVNICLEILKKSNNYNAYMRYCDNLNIICLRLFKLQELSMYYNKDDFYPFVLTVLDDARSQINDFIQNSYCEIPESLCLDLLKYDALIFKAFKDIRLDELLFSYDKYKTIYAL